MVSVAANGTFMRVREMVTAFTAGVVVADVSMCMRAAVEALALAPVRSSPAEAVAALLAIATAVEDELSRGSWDKGEEDEVEEDVAV